NWQEYADLLCLSSFALSDVNARQARRDFDAAAAMWDGRGFNDRVAKTSNQYATYKLALCLLAAAKLGPKPPIHEAVLQKVLAQQADDGGWITDYDAQGRRVGLANVETTSLAILALTRGL